MLSAHRTPDALEEYVADVEARGRQVFVAAAGGAAHLAGVVASKTLLPVLGVPMGTQLGGLDSLLSTVQMPAGIPVGDARDRACRSGQCGAARRGDPRALGRGAREPPPAVPQGAGAEDPRRGDPAATGGRVRGRPARRSLRRRENGEQVVAVALELDRAEALDRPRARRASAAGRPRAPAASSRAARRRRARRPSRERSSRQWRRRSTSPSSASSRRALVRIVGARRPDRLRARESRRASSVSTSAPEASRSCTQR